MKRIFAILLALATLVTACEKSEDGGKKTGGSHERSILAISFAGQTGGEAEIVSEDPEVGTVTFELAGNVDLSAVEITSLTISYKATASAKKGDKIDFSGDAPKIVVTSEAGDARTYTVLAKTFEEKFVGCYKITSSICYAGFDVDDGGCELMAPEKKEHCWDKNGYGPKANYDDYFESTLVKINDDGTTEGTCKLYGGENGKHWNCVFDGQYNLDNPGTSLDLRKLYRLIPMGESTWKRDYVANTITFTKNGVSNVCFLYPAGTYNVGKKSDGSTSYDVVVEDEALVAQLQGNYEFDEKYIFKDYSKFVRDPRIFGYMISKVNEIPAASKTAGDEGPIDAVEPGGESSGGDDSGDEGDPTSVTLTGSWKVSSLKVFGGQGSTGWVEVKDKSWEWNDSYSAEYDNILTLGGETSGSYSYAAGPDGKFWDCVLVEGVNKLGTGPIDLSYNYAQLPRSTGTFTAAALPVGVAGAYSFSSGSFSGFLLKGGVDVKTVIDAAKALIPTLPDVPSLKIPAGGIAIGYQLREYSQAYTWDDSWMYGDFDRFVLHPYAYAMIFEKQQ